MFFLIVTFFTLLIGLQSACYYMEDQQLRKLKRREKGEHLPIFTCGSKLNAFTIEHCKMLDASVVVGMNYMRRFFIYIISFVFRPKYPYKWLHDLGYRKALVKLQDQVKDDNYLVNFQTNFIHLPKGMLFVQLTATSIKLYKDTLGIYHLPESKINLPKFLKRKFIFNKFLQTILLTFIVFVFSIQLLIQRANTIADEMTKEDEEVLWSYLSTSNYLQLKDQKDYLFDAEMKLNTLLSNIPLKNDTKKYDYYIIVAEDTDTAMYLLPAGRIVFTKGLLDMLSSKQEVEFLIADAVAHFELKQHLKAMSYDLINPYFAIRTFGSKSFIAKWVVRFSSFYNISFGWDQEKSANQLALGIMNKTFGGVVNVGILNENLLTEQSKFINQHPVQKDTLFNFISSNELTISETTPLDLDLAPSSIKVLENPQTSEELGEFDQVMKNADKSFNLIYNGYHAALKPLDDVLDPNTLMTEEYLNYKKELIEYGYEIIDFYDNALTNALQDLNTQALDAFNKEKNKETAAYYRAVYNRAAEKFFNMMKFNFGRDDEVLKYEINVINFLLKRVGNYKLGKNTLIFTTPNDQQSFEQMLDRINNIKNTKPTE